MANVPTSGNGGILNAASSSRPSTTASSTSNRPKGSTLFNRLIHARDFADRPTSSSSNLERTISFHNDVGREDYSAMRAQSGSSDPDVKERALEEGSAQGHIRNTSASSQGDDDRDEDDELLNAETDRDSEHHCIVAADRRSNADDDDDRDTLDQHTDEDGDDGADTATLSSVDMSEYRPHYIGRSVVRRLVSRVRSRDEAAAAESSDEEEEVAAGSLHTYRKAPIFSGTMAPFAIMLEVPGFTSKWYVRTDGVEYKDNPVILDVGLALSLTAAVIANILIISRFMEMARPRRSTIIAITCFILHDMINISALVSFGVIHAVNDGFTYSEAYWMTLGSTIASLLVTISLVVDVRGTANFRDAGSGLTQKQRELVIAVMAMLMFLSFSALIFNLLHKDMDFITALYFTVVTVTTVGFGDITPTNTASRIVLMFIAPTGIVVVALVIATARRTILEEFENSYHRRREEYKKHHAERIKARKLNSAARAQVRRTSGRGGGGGITTGLTGLGALSAAQSGPMLLDIGTGAFKSRAQAAGRGAAAAGRGASAAASSVVDNVKTGVENIVYGADQQAAKRDDDEKKDSDEVKQATTEEEGSKGPTSIESKEVTTAAQEKASLQHDSISDLPEKEVLSPSRSPPRRTGTFSRWVPSPSAIFPAEGFARNPPPPQNPSRTFTSSLEPFGAGRSGTSDGSGDSSITKEKDAVSSETNMLDEVAAIDASLIQQRKALEAQWKQYREGVRKSEKAEFVVKLSVSFGLFIFFWVLGALIFMATEKWGFFVSLYFCFVFFSTIGYGDFTPKTPAGRACFIVYALFGIGVLTILFAVVSDAWGNAFTNALKKTTKRGVLSSHLRRIRRRKRPMASLLTKGKKRGDGQSEHEREDSAPGELAGNVDEAEKGTRSGATNARQAGSTQQRRKRASTLTRRPTSKRTNSYHEPDPSSLSRPSSVTGEKRSSAEAREEDPSAEELPLLIARSAMALQEHAAASLKHEELAALIEALPEVANVVPARFGGRAVVPSAGRWLQMRRAASEAQLRGRELDEPIVVSAAADVSAGPADTKPLTRVEVLRARRARNDHMDTLLDLIRRLKNPDTSAAAEQAFALVRFDDHLHDLLHHSEELLTTIRDLRKENASLKSAAAGDPEATGGTGDTSHTDKDQAVAPEDGELQAEADVAAVSSTLQHAEEIAGMEDG